MSLVGSVVTSVQPSAIISYKFGFSKVFFNGNCFHHFYRGNENASRTFFPLHRKIFFYNFWISGKKSRSGPDLRAEKLVAFSSKATNYSFQLHVERNFSALTVYEDAQVYFFEITPKFVK